MDTASIVTEAEKSRDAKEVNTNQPETGGKETAEKDKLLDTLMGKPSPKEDSPNPQTAKTEKSPLSEPTSEQQKKSAKGAIMTNGKKPSVREELRKIKESRKDKETEASPVKERNSGKGNRNKPAGRMEHKQPQKRRKKPKSKGAR